MTHRVVSKRKKARLKQLKIKELSLVDKPANPHAQVTLFKRDDTDGSEFVESIVKYYVSSEEGAMSFMDVLEKDMEQKRYYEVMDAVCPYIYALESSLKSIAGDKNITSESKQSMMRVSAEGFLTVIQDKWPDVEQALQKSLLDGGDSNPGEDEMSDDKMKALEKQIEDLQAQLKAATEASEDAEKASEMQSKLNDTSKALEELQAKFEALEAEKEEEAFKGSMTDAEKEYMNGLSDEEKRKEFMRMPSKDRRRMMNKAEEEDETIKVDGRVIRKSVVGEDQFAVIKSQQERIANQDEEIAKEREARLTAELTKRAEDELSHYEGETTEKVKVLRAIEKMEDGPKSTLLKMLKGGEGALSLAFDKMGHRGQEEVDKGASEKFEKHVSTIMTNEKVDKNEAMALARERHPDDFEAWQSAVPGAAPAN